jgi:hypothetical protein
MVLKLPVVITKYVGLVSQNICEENLNYAVILGRSSSLLQDGAATTTNTLQCRLPPPCKQPTSLHDSRKQHTLTCRVLITPVSESMVNFCLSPGADKNV